MSQFIKWYETDGQTLHPVERRLAYYEALDTAHVKQDYAPFIELVVDVVAEGFQPYWHALGVDVGELRG